MVFFLVSLQQVKNLKKEIEILKKLAHVNIVKLYYAEDTSDALSIFMEYVPNVSNMSYTCANISQALLGSSTLVVLGLSNR